MKVYATQPKGRHSAASTVSAVNELKAGFPSWAAAAKSLGYPPAMGATLSAVANNRTGAISAEREEALRVRLGLRSVKLTKAVDVCPDCLEAHVFAGGCNHKPIATIAILAPGEIVAPASPSGRRRAYSPAWVETAAAILETARAAGKAALTPNSGACYNRNGTKVSPASGWEMLG